MKEFEAICKAWSRMLRTRSARRSGTQPRHAFGQLVDKLHAAGWKVWANEKDELLSVRDPEGRVHEFRVQSVPRCGT